MVKNKRKIKIYIQTQDKVIDLPRMSINSASLILKFGLKHIDRFVQDDSSLPVVIDQNRQEILTLIDMAINIIEDCEPFVLADIMSGNERISIEIL